MHIEIGAGMSAPNEAYLALSRATSEVSNALYFLLQDLSIRDPEAREPSEMLDTKYGRSIIHAFVRYQSTYGDGEVKPAVPTGFSSAYPIIPNIEVARTLRNTLIALRSDVVNGRFDIDTSAGIDGFRRSIDEYFAVQFGATPDADAVAGAMFMLPHVLDWNNREDAGTFGEYLRLRRSFVTFHTQQQIYVQQLNAAIQRLDDGDLNDDLVIELRDIQTRIENMVADLHAYFFEHGSLSRLHTEQLQNSLFHENRGYRVYAGRLVLNVSQANDLDHSGDFGSLLLVAVNNWFNKQGGKVKSAVQSGEKTSYQFIVENPEDQNLLFTDEFSKEIRRELRLEYDRRYKGVRKVDAKARDLLRCIDAFTARGDATVLPFDSKNILDLAIQDATDIEAFGELLMVAGVPDRLSDDMGAMLKMRGDGRTDAARVLFDRIKPWLEGKELDMQRMKDWVNDKANGEAESERRKKILQAFVLQGVFYHLKHLSGILDYFEKEKASVGPVGVYFESDLPGRSDEVEHAKLQAYLARDKYVSDGAYNPSIDAEHLLDEELMQHLPHLKILLEQEWVENSKNLDQKVSRILRIWDRSQKLWGILDHERPDSEGGGKQVLYKAIDDLAKAVAGGRGEDAGTALLELKSASNRFTDTMRYMWAKAIADPKHPYLLKRDVTGRTSNGSIINVDVFKQELARLGWTDVMGVEADSMQAYLRAHSMEFAPDFNDAAFLSAWDMILEVAWEWRMPFPLIYRPAGDFVMVVIPPKDINGVSVNIEAFTYEVWSRVAEKYKDKPFHDVKKVGMSRSIVSLNASYDNGYLHSLLTEIADDLNLQTVPFMLPERNNTFLLYRADENGWGDSDVDTQQIVDELQRRGVSIKSYHLDVESAFERLGMYYDSEGADRRYRYAKFNPEGDWKRFMKTLTFTTVVGKSGRVINHVTAKNFGTMQDDMADDAEAAKEKNAPHKKGFAIHESAKITGANVEDRILEQWGRYEELAKYVEGNLQNMEEYVSDLFLDPDLDATFEDIVKLNIRGRSDFAPKFEMSRSRFRADNSSFEFALQAAGVDLLGNQERSKWDLFRLRSQAREILKDIIDAFQVIEDIVVKGRGEFDDGDNTAATVAVSLLNAKAEEFRALRLKPGDEPGGSGGGEQGGSKVEAPTGGGAAAGTKESRRGDEVDAAAFYEDLWYANAYGGGVIETHATEFDGFGAVNTTTDVEINPQFVTSMSYTYTAPVDPYAGSWLNTQGSLHGGAYLLGQTYAGLPPIPIAPMQMAGTTTCTTWSTGAFRAAF